MLPQTLRLAGVIRRVHTTIRPKLLALLEEQPPDKRVIRLRSPRELRRLMAEIEAQREFPEPQRHGAHGDSKY